MPPPPHWGSPVTGSRGDAPWPYRTQAGCPPTQPRGRSPRDAVSDGKEQIFQGQESPDGDVSLSQRSCWTGSGSPGGQGPHLIAPAVRGSLPRRGTQSPRLNYSASQPPEDCLKQVPGEHTRFDANTSRLRRGKCILSSKRRKAAPAV